MELQAIPKRKRDGLLGPSDSLAHIISIKIQEDTLRIPICILFFAVATSPHLIGQESNAVGEKPASTQPAPKLPELGTELIAMGDEDQKFRTILQEAMIKASSSSGAKTLKDLPELIKKQAEIDHKNLARLEEIIQKHGWPGKSLVGDKGSIAAFLILQHSEQSTQEKYLEVFKKAAKSGEARKADAAMLEDRVLMRQGKKQIYGTQLQSNAESQGKLFLYPVEDEVHVDERRESVGLPTMKEYLKHFGLEYEPPVAAKP